MIAVPAHAPIVWLLALLLTARGWWRCFAELRRWQKLAKKQRQLIDFMAEQGRLVMCSECEREWDARVPTVEQLESWPWLDRSARGAGRSA